SSGTEAVCGRGGKASAALMSGRVDDRSSPAGGGDDDGPAGGAGRGRRSAACGADTAARRGAGWAGCAKRSTGNSSSASSTPESARKRRMSRSAAGLWVVSAVILRSFTRESQVAAAIASSGGGDARILHQVELAARREVGDEEGKSRRRTRVDMAVPVEEAVVGLEVAAEAGEAVGGDGLRILLALVEGEAVAEEARPVAHLLQLELELDPCLAA